MRKPRGTLKKNQRGATLIIALLILVMIMMYGIPAAIDSMQNERMAGNSRNRDLAFQAAEFTLTEAENWISSMTFTDIGNLAPANFSCNSASDDDDPTPGDGIFPNGECHANDITYWRNFDWSQGVAPSKSMDVDLVIAQPRYIIERMPDATINSARKRYYRITAQAVGQDANAVVVLQTMYEY